MDRERRQPDVVPDARRVRGVAPGAVRQQVVPNNEVAGLHGGLVHRQRLRAGLREYLVRCQQVAGAAHAQLRIAAQREVLSGEQVVVPWHEPAVHPAPPSD